MRFQFLLISLWLACLQGAPAAEPAKQGWAPRAFHLFGLEPKSREDAATAYWELRAKYSRSTTENDDLRFRARPPKTPEEARIRGIYDALDDIYFALYGRGVPWPVHSMDIWFNPRFLRPEDLLIVTYEPQFLERPLSETKPEGMNTHFYSDLDEHLTGQVWARRLRLAREAVSLETVSYDHLSEKSYSFDEVLFQTERTLEVYVQRGVVSARTAAKLRDSEARLDLTRTIQWTFMHPRLQEPLYHFRIQDSSREANPVGKGWWVFKATRRKLRLNVELNNPDFVLPERRKYGEGAKLIEIQRLFKDPAIEKGVEAGFGLAAVAIHELHANPDGTFPPEVMIYGETTSDLIEMYRDRYQFEILGQTAGGTWIMRIAPGKFYELYGRNAPIPVLRSSCVDALKVIDRPRAEPGS